MLTIITKLRICYGIIYRIRSSTNVFCLLALYHAFATYDMNYCITTWHAGNAEMLNQTKNSAIKLFGVFFIETKFSK